MSLYPSQFNFPFLLYLSHLKQLLWEPHICWSLSSLSGKTKQISVFSCESMSHASTDIQWCLLLPLVHNTPRTTVLTSVVQVWFWFSHPPHSPPELGGEAAAGDRGLWLLGWGGTLHLPVLRDLCEDVLPLKRFQPFIFLPWDQESPACISRVISNRWFCLGNLLKISYLFALQDKKKNLSFLL